MKAFIIFLTILCLSLIDIYAQLERLDRQPDEERAINDFSKPSSLDSIQLDSLIINAMNIYHIPGFAALINSKDDGTLWKRNFGYANISLNQAVEDSTLFLVASVSKTIVCTAIMQFWEADSFDLDDNINDYLDDFQVNNPYHPNDTITFRMLMTHMSSIQDNWNILEPLIICGDSPIPLHSFLSNYLTPGGSYYSPANFINLVPDTLWVYTNVGVCILAYLVEKFSGMPFDQYCRENIFDPLHMDKTSWFLEGMDPIAIATPYLWQGGQYVPYCHQGFPYYPAGQLRTNKIELEHFLLAYMNWGSFNGIRILDSSTVNLILTEQLGYPIPGYGDYQGLIWYQSGELNGRFPWGHGGSWPGYRSGMFFKQYEEWGIICFINSRPDDSAFLYLLNLLCDYAEIIIPVELTSFTAASNGKEVILNWSTATEINNQGFGIERQVSSKQPAGGEVSPNGGYAVSSRWEEIGFVPGFGTTTEPKSYSYSDQPDKSGTYYYRLKQVDYDGSYEYSPEVEVEVSAPLEFSLEQNYPNPFNPNTVIGFSLPEDVSNVKLSIYNALGEKVAELVNTALTAGKYRYQWNAQNVATGMYIYELRTDKFVSVKKMVFIK